MVGKQSNLLVISQAANEVLQGGGLHWCEAVSQVCLLWLFIQIVQFIPALLSRCLEKKEEPDHDLGTLPTYLVSHQARSEFNPLISLHSITGPQKGTKTKILT